MSTYSLIWMVVCLSLGRGVLMAKEEDGTKGDLYQYFHNIKFDSKNIILVRHSAGRRMTLIVGTYPGDLNDPGSTFKVAVGTKFTLFERNSGIEFIPLTESHDLVVFLMKPY